MDYNIWKMGKEEEGVTDDIFYYRSGKYIEDRGAASFWKLFHYMRGKERERERG